MPSVDFSAELFYEARQAGETDNVTPDVKIRGWAALGQTIERLLQNPTIGNRRTLSEALAAADTVDGRQRLQNYLANQPFPHYGSVPGRPRYYLRLDADGRQTVGRFVNRQFVPEDQ